VVVLIAWERIPAWRASNLLEFQTGFEHTLRRVDRLQPARSWSSALARPSAFRQHGWCRRRRTLAVLAAGGFLLVLVGSAAWLI